ncbi:hypothetical protein [Treponema denticola]|uniref:hypothetical protein n=1 Tax=Treponema denticola TaxID=158 RepID=UPI002104957D|nr:hypothetical protein [Treponema denticola]UTY24240.1 hypothetical protein E4N78_09000 [Treponema denticola]
MKQKYSKQEIQTIGFLIQKHGSLSYMKPSDLEDEYFKLTNVKRSHGCLYMASWRFLKGYYESLLAG